VFLRSFAFDVSYSLHQHSRVDSLGGGGQRRRTRDSPVAAAAHSDPGLPDVSTSHPYHTAISHLAERGIIDGYANGTFGPNDPVTRQQFGRAKDIHL